MEYEILKELISDQLRAAEADGDIVIVTPAEQGLIKRICDGIYPFLEGSISQEEMNGIVGVLREVLYGTNFYDSEMEHTGLVWHVRYLKAIFVNCHHPFNKAMLHRTLRALDSLSAASFVHGFAIVAQTNQLKVCRKWRRYYLKELQCLKKFQ